MDRYRSSRVLALGRLTVEAIVRELNETLRRTEEARIYHWMHNTGKYPPRRTLPHAPTATTVLVGLPCGPPGTLQAA